ncbi:uncharacterized protein IL334_003993 [Kwoniella shivajii]|uniref:Nudix hydrolase domain-containing protein n=1 Tax=Kwoniella shivajii TaxID=564305 RepID=A0ABZ1CZ40_9TREE|nr:hypothetical protein IL334_003993 [Kwoniella shivajii]
MTKSDGPRHVAVSIVYSPSTGRLLMVTSRAHPDLWIFPKGGIEKGESSGQAAVRESWEEAGTPNSLPSPKDEERLMMLSLPSKKGKHGSIWHVHVLEVKEDVVECIQEWPESNQRKRNWFNPEQCLSKIQEWSNVPSHGENDNHDETPTTAGILKHSEDDNDAEDVRDDAKGESKKEKKKKQQKKEKKGGAMELALRHFMELKGL